MSHISFLISLGSLYNHLNFTLQNATLPVYPKQTIYQCLTNININKCKPTAIFSESIWLWEFLIHTNPLALTLLSDQKTSRWVFCVHRGVNVNSLAVQYPLYFYSLTRQNELYHRVSPKQPVGVCVCACMFEGRWWLDVSVRHVAFLFHISFCRPCAE